MGVPSGFNSPVGTSGRQRLRTASGEDSRRRRFLRYKAALIGGVNDTSVVAVVNIVHNQTLKERL